MHRGKGRALRRHRHYERGCHRSHPDLDTWISVGLSGGPSLNGASGEAPSFGCGAAEAHPLREPLVLPALWPRSPPPHGRLGVHPPRDGARTSAKAPSPSSPAAGWPARGAELRVPRPPAPLQMAGSSGRFANDQVRLKPQSLWLPAAVISHTVSDPIIAAPSPSTPPTSSV